MAGKRSFVIFIVENRLFTEESGKVCRNLGDEFSLLSRE